MGAPKGNKNGRGNKNSGRKTAYQEKANADWLAEAFFKEHTEEELRDMAKKKSISSRMIEDALKGNKDYILAIFKKLFPDLSKNENDHSGEVTVFQKYAKN